MMQKHLTDVFKHRPVQESETSQPTKAPLKLKFSYTLPAQIHRRKFLPLCQVRDHLNTICLFTFYLLYSRMDLRRVIDTQNEIDYNEFKICNQV